MGRIGKPIDGMRDLTRPGTVTLLDSDVMSTIMPDWNGNTATWMGTLRGNPKLHEIVIPGSHDAGVYTGAQSVGPTQLAWAQCQDGTIGQQADWGSRMFDLRMYKYPLPGGQGHSVRAGHFPPKVLGINFEVGAYGGGLHTVLQHAANFVNTNPSEFLILRFTKSADCVDDMVTEVQQLAPVRVYTSMTNIAQTKVQSLAGKLVLVFDDGFRTALRANPNFTGGAPNYVTFNQHLLWFDKYPIMIPTGLSTCGEYADDDKMEKVYSKMKDQATEHYTHQSKDQHLHFVYWQQTIKMGDIRKATEGKEGAHEMLDVFAKEAVANVLNAVWDIPNVISHDFVKQATCSKIIDINQRLGKI